MELIQTKSIDLSKAILIGQGTHKRCFIHPNDRTKCIKIAYNSLGEKDLKREIFYLNTPFRKNTPTHVLPKYYGPVDTNNGQGYIWELVQNDNGTPCFNLENWLKDSKTSKEDTLINQAILVLKHTLLKDEIITMSIWPENILLKKIGTSYLPVLVNDLGTSAYFPVIYYFSCLRKKHIRRRWIEFCKLALTMASNTKKTFVKEW